MKTGGMVDMKKLKERGKDKYVQTGSELNSPAPLAWVCVPPRSWDMLQLLHDLKYPLCSVKSMLFKSKRKQKLFKSEFSVM